MITKNNTPFDSSEIKNYEHEGVSYLRSQYTITVNKIQYSRPVILTEKDRRGFEFFFYEKLYEMLYSHIGELIKSKRKELSDTTIDLIQKDIEDYFFSE